MRKRDLSFCAALDPESRTSKGHGDRGPGSPSNAKVSASSFLSDPLQPSPRPAIYFSLINCPSLFLPLTPHFINQTPLTPPSAKILKPVTRLTSRHFRETGLDWPLLEPPRSACRHHMQICFDGPHEAEPNHTSWDRGFDDRHSNQECRRMGTLMQPASFWLSLLRANHTRPKE